MITPLLIQLFEEDLTKLAEEIKLYPNDASLWTLKDGISNTGGNLCLHLVGNLQHYIGAVLGESGYIRNRDAEFSLKNISRNKLLDEIEATRVVVKDALEQMSKTDMQKEYPHRVLLDRDSTTTEYFLIHLLSHLNYHLGQINYHRRLLATS